MRRLAFRIGIGLCGLVLVFGHLSVLQGAAWVAMLLERSMEMPIGSAIESTFDGQHPCAVCQMVSKERASDQKIPSDLSKTWKRIEFTLAPVDIHLPETSAAAIGSPVSARRLVGIDRQPPTPPPRWMG